MRIKNGPWGTAGISHPGNPSRKNRYILIFPGYTGNALSHVRFIEEARSRGFGIIAITPLWDDDIGVNVERVRDAIIQIGTEINLGDIRLIRANSFGAFLATQVLDLLGNVEVAAFIAPCSTEQLITVGEKMGIKVTAGRSFTVRGTVPHVRIYLLREDNMVPEFDAAFFGKISGSYEIERFDGEHFTAGDSGESCCGVLEWFEKYL